jgi:beta-glucosidase
MKEYGVNAHRMSLSWCRIIPGGGRDQPVNKKGIEFYRKVIQGLLDAGIVSSLYSHQVHS